MADSGRLYQRRRLGFPAAVPVAAARALRGRPAGDAAQHPDDLVGELGAVIGTLWRRLNPADELVAVQLLHEDGGLAAPDRRGADASLRERRQCSSCKSQRIQSGQGE